MKNKKIILFLIAFIIVMFALCSTVFALHPGEVLINDNIEGTEELKDFGNKALGVIQTIGVVASVIILIVCGLKYMTGSVEEKAGYKKALVPYVVGAILLFAVPTVVNVVYEFAGGGDVSLKKEWSWFCPNGNVVETSWVDVEGTDNDTEMAFTCTTKDCGCGLKESLSGATAAYACPKCKVKLTGTNKNYCESCGNYYNDKKYYK